MTDGGEKLYGENNPFYGHRHDEKTKEKISKIASLRTGEKILFIIITTQKKLKIK